MPASSSWRAVLGPLLSASIGGQLARAGLRLFGQLPCQRVQPLGRAATDGSASRGVPFHDGRAVLRTVRDYRFDGLEPGAEGALFQKAHQLQQVRRQPSFRRARHRTAFSAAWGSAVLVGTSSTASTTAIRGFVTPAKRHQHHAAGQDPADQLCRDACRNTACQSGSFASSTAGLGNLSSVIRRCRAAA